CKNPACRPVLEAAPVLTDSLCGPCADHFQRVRGYLDAMALPYVVNTRLVRGFDYYVRTAFELLTTELGAQNAVAGGGRYDGLVALLGGPPDAATGFAIGMERVVLLLAGTAAACAPLAYLIPLGDEALARLLAVAQEARKRGVPLEIGYGTRKLRTELERAHRLGADHVVIVGETELGRGEAIMREMKSGSQRTIRLDDVGDELVALWTPAGPGLVVSRERSDGGGGAMSRPPTSILRP